MRVISPIDEFLKWFKGLSKNHQVALSRMFWILTTSNANEMVLNDEEYIVKFENHLTNPDFPLRILMKLLIVTTVFDFIFENHDEFYQIVSKSSISAMPNVIFLEKKHWEKIKLSWWELRNNILSSDIFSIWMEQISRSFK